LALMAAMGRQETPGSGIWGSALANYLLMVAAKTLSVKNSPPVTR
jgi:uncharacterized membrane protein